MNSSVSCWCKGVFRWWFCRYFCPGIGTLRACMSKMFKMHACMLYMIFSYEHACSKCLDPTIRLFWQACARVEVITAFLNLEVGHECDTVPLLWCTREKHVFEIRSLASRTRSRLLKCPTLPIGSRFMNSRGLYSNISKNIYLISSIFGVSDIRWPILVSRVRTQGRLGLTI